MTLFAATWSDNTRLQNAANNSPAMRAFEPDSTAVSLLQQALVDTGVTPDLNVDGAYGNNTAQAVRQAELRFHMDSDGGAAGRQVLGVLDILEQSGQFGADLAITDTPLAGSKVRAAVTALNTLRTALANNGPLNITTTDALRVHFRLFIATPTIGVGRVVTDADLNLILTIYGQIITLFAAASTRFTTGVPVNGIFTAAEAPFGGPVRFGPAYTNVNSNFGGLIGPNSRAAVVIHESVHVFDRDSGRADIHISEFDPAYDVQDPDLSLHNPSSYAGFAAHIFAGSDPVPRFGLGPTSRAL